MLHLTKVAVGVRDVAHLRTIQAGRAASEPPLRHRTRTMPKRAEEIRAGGSLYWVIRGMVIVRQRVIDLRTDQWEDGSACTGLILDPALQPVLGRPVKPFQGWRYLEAASAPPDQPALGAGDLAELPEALRVALVELCLL